MLTLVVLQSATLLILLVMAVGRIFVPAYLTEKGKNLATKQDVEVCGSDCLPARDANVRALNPPSVISDLRLISPIKVAILIQCEGGLQCPRRLETRAIAARAASINPFSRGSHGDPSSENSCQPRFMLA